MIFDLHNKDCLEILPTIPDNSVDLIFCDLPYGQTNCKWDSIIPIDKLWIEFKRIRKDTTPIIMCCTTKFGHTLINANPKEFKMDMVWQKSRKCGFLQARKRPMVGHEMVYFFWKKQPKYNYLKYHTYTKKESKSRTIDKKLLKVYTHGDVLNKPHRKVIDKGTGSYEPILPDSVIVNDKIDDEKRKSKEMYNVGDNFLENNRGTYYPTLPGSVISNKGGEVFGSLKRPINDTGGPSYEPKLPGSVIVNDAVYGELNDGKINDNSKIGGPSYEPILPDSVIVNEPDSILKIASKKPSKHSTGKPLELMEFILKYWTDEGDIVFDPTFGGGSMPIQAKIMKRQFIGCEMDKKIYDDAVKLINTF